MPVLIFTEREGFAHQIGAPLAQGIVEALNMCGLAALFADGVMTLGGQNQRIRLPEIAITDGAFAIIGWQRLPEFEAGLSCPIAEREPDNPSGLAFQGHPNPDLVAFLTHERPQFVEFENRAFTERTDCFTNWCQDFFLRIAAIVLRLIPTVRAIARCDKRSCCSFSTVAR